MPQLINKKRLKMLSRLSLINLNFRRMRRGLSSMEKEEFGRS